MSGVLFALQLIGRILLVLLIVIVVLCLLILFVPIRYQGECKADDPQPHDDPQWDTFKDRITASASCAWLGPLLEACVSWDGELLLDLRIAWIHVNPMIWLHKDPESQEDKAPSQEMPRAGIYDRIVKVARKADYYKRVLDKEETGYAVRRLKEILARALTRILPENWQMTGTIGLGDPAATAKVLEVQGILYPFVAGHVDIEPVFQQWQMNVAADMRGRIRLIHLLTAVVSIAADRKIRLTFRRIKNADRNIASHYKQSAQSAPRMQET